MVIKWSKPVSLLKQLLRWSAINRLSTDWATYIITDVLCAIEQYQPIKLPIHLSTSLSTYIPIYLHLHLTSETNVCSVECFSAAVQFISQFSDTLCLVSIINHAQAARCQWTYNPIIYIHGASSSSSSLPWYTFSFTLSEFLKSIYLSFMYRGES